MKNLAPLTEESRPRLNNYLKSFPPVISELTFTNLFVWRENRPIWYREMAGGLLFFIKSGICRENEFILFGPPSGPVKLPDIFNEYGRKLLGAVRLTKDRLKEIDPDEFTVTTDRDNSDYVYRVSDLVELPGRHYAGKRNHIRQCLKKYPCAFEPINAANLEDCAKLLTRWCRLRSCELSPGLCSESLAIREALSHFHKFQLLGGAIRINGEIQAFSLGERLNQDTGVWHFEKAMPEFTGLGQLINHWFAKNCLTDFIYVNREQDLGIAGLRQAKKSYRPDHMLEKFSVFRRYP